MDIFLCYPFLCALEVVADEGGVEMWVGTIAQLNEGFSAQFLGPSAKEDMGHIGQWNRIDNPEIDLTDIPSLILTKRKGNSMEEA